MKYKTSVKDESLIEKRRHQMIRAGVTLFKEKGFHRQQQEKLQKKLALVLALCMNTFGQKKMYSI